MNSTDDGLFERIDRLDEEMESTVNDLMRFPEMFPVAFTRTDLISDDLASHSFFFILSI